MIRWMRAFLYGGRHHWSPSDMSPPGHVWFHDGIWWTFNRRSRQRVPRLFNERSNPLDHEEIIAEVWNDCKQRRRYAEVEY